MVLLQPIVFHIVKSATKESMGHERMEVDECDSIEKSMWCAANKYQT